MFNIRIWYDNTIGIEDVPEAFGIMFINSVNIIGCLLDNQMIENFTTTFVKNIVFHHVGLSWIIKSNQKLNFDFQLYCPSQIFYIKDKTPTKNSVGH